MTTIRADQRARVYALVFVCAAVLLLLLPWHLANHRIPIWDEASFAGLVEDMLARFKDGLWAGIRGLYVLRDWRPIIFPTIAAPFFALAHGKILLGIGLTACFSVALIAVYTLLLLREFMSYQRAIIGALFIITSPWLLNFGYRFFAEIFWLAAASGFLFHLVAGLSRRPQLHLALAGFWLGLMGATRPAETVVVAFLPGLFLLAAEWRRGKIALIDLGVLVAQGGILGLVIWQLIQVGSAAKVQILLLLAIYAALTGWRRRRFFIQAPILGMIVIAETIFMAWHIQSMRELYSWSFETSFGPMAKLPYASFKGFSLLPVLDAFAQNFNLGILALFGLGDAFALLVTRTTAKFDETTKRALGLVLLAVLMLAPMLAMLWITHTLDMRRPMTGVLTLYIGLVAIALLPNIAWPHIRLAIVLVITALQIATAVSNETGFRPSLVARWEHLFGSLTPPLRTVDANDAMMDRLADLGIRSGRLAVYSLCYRDNVSGCTRRGLPVIEVQALNSLAREKGLSLYVNFPRDLDFTKPDTLAAQLNRNLYHYVLVDMFDTPDQVVAVDPVFDHTFNFIALVRQGLPQGFAEIAKFTADGREFHLLSANAEATTDLPPAK